MGKNFGHRGNRHSFKGKPREEFHPYDRKSGTGRGNELKKGGFGKGNVGSVKFVYVKKGEAYVEKEEEEGN